MVLKWYNGIIINVNINVKLILLWWAMRSLISSMTCVLFIRESNRAYMHEIEEWNKSGSYFLHSVTQGFFFVTTECVTVW